MTCAVLGSPTAANAQITQATVDTFQDGTLMNWAGANRSNAAGGPGGASDLYLRVDNGGSGNRVAFHNSDARWVGNYQSAGVTALRAEMANFGPQTMEIRLVLFGFTPTGAGRWTSTTAAVIQPNSTWQTYTFSVAQSSLTNVLGSVPYDTMITNVTQIMFRHDPGTPSSGGSTGDGLIGIDNIRAVPAPGAAMIIGAGGSVLAMRRRRRE
jgi:hypothetical protein